MTLPKGSDPEALFRAYSPWLLRTLQHKFGREVADDLLQETYLRVTRHAATIEILKPKAFLLQVARNVFLNGYRQKRNRAALEQPLLATRAQTTAADQVETIVLKDIILGMPEKLRDVFVLSRFGAMSQQQIADHLGISPKTVEWRMTKALAYCAAQLRE
ncbi:RNA polymerase sigma factor [Brevundimonas sp.]|uniref:RNA polymerase sigma factor n=1 Tax=Brevundimonas sp. TaxID=1871086 RepID=UPI003BAACE94